MGLNIIYYENLEPADTSECEYEGEDFCQASGHETFYLSYWPERAEGLPESSNKSPKHHGCFLASHVGSLRAGSYGSYSTWRNWLCEMQFGYSAKDMWNTPTLKQAAEGMPFSELINFSDCEGTIGPIVSAKLHDDFKRNRQKARGDALKHFAGGGEAKYYIEKYELWMTAFEVAANNGAVRFC